MWAIRYFIEESFSFIKYAQSLEHPVNIDIAAITSNLNKAFKLDNDSFLIEVDEVDNFTSDNFWGGYNIIEPTESLEHAVNKLKKQQKQ